MGGARTFDELMQALRGYQESRALLTALELDVFSAAREFSTAQEIASRTGTDARATEMLLNALVALGALEKRDGCFRCTPESKAFGPARAGLMHTVNQWDTWSTLSQCVRTGSSVVARRPGGSRSPERTEHFIAAMHARAAVSADALARAVGAEGATRMLDVGGGPATFSMAFARANPALRAEVLDLEPVVPMALRNIREAGLEGRVTARAGDLRKDDFGGGYDLVLLSAVCHMLGEDENRDLLRRCARALVPGGRLVIRDFLLEPDRTAPRHAALFALNMLVGTLRGNSYTEGEYRRWLGDAGFTETTRLHLEEDVIVARRA